MPIYFSEEERYLYRTYAYKSPQSNPYYSHHVKKIFKETKDTEISSEDT